ncbi:MAG TPA: twin-arginine translocation signal domain-containing protein [Gammaproteobacteria bacterium]|nr:twin-arginine translocation signal domain-containing protein [Gammaproteobacteria bacterium]
MIKRYIRRRDFVKGSAVVLAILATGGCMKTIPTPTPVITTKTGKLQGEIVRGVHRFLNPVCRSTIR